MLEITGKDIASLNDEDLRSLVGLLCEAELRQRNLSRSAVTWGGDQNAKDGGLDVRVTLSASTSIDGFIPRSNTGFQVKKPDMPRASILKEMRPKPAKLLRPVIAELAKASGAYIIVSAASTSEIALADRRAAMSEAVVDCPDAAKLELRFYDRGQLATWVRDHAGLMLWVRSKIGRAVKGWRTYGAWSHRPSDADSTYLVDKQARIKTGDKDEGDGIPATEGIDKIRHLLRMPGNVVRLVGLSGVGKTRLVEALFEPAVGTDALDPSLAVYTNSADDPDPPPSLMASDLIALRSRAVVIVDNCTPAIHRQLSDVARAKGSTVSVITIEYDIREDQPEGTDVFALENSSVALIETLIERRAPHISQIDRRTVAESSGGNARIALALADTVGKNETIAGLSDADLFDRLFQQRNTPDSALLSIAQACSLIYSFDIETMDGDDAELPVIAGLAGKSINEVFAGVAELEQRQLVQARGQWRALLPHAIANRLAETALKRISRPALLSAFERGPLRLLQSFSRRLGFLDRSPEARSIVETWLAPGGLLADIPNLNETGKAMFMNIAPVVPDAVLKTLDKAFASAGEATLRNCMHITVLLRSLAYDAKYFTRAVALLVVFARLTQQNDAQNNARSMFESLFYVALSGTHAPLGTRLNVLEKLLHSNDPRERELGVAGLESLMKSDHFMSSYPFEFGMRSRDYGYYPPTGADVAVWFSAVLDFAERLVLTDDDVGIGVRRAIAHEFRGLWTNAGRMDHLERIAHTITAKRFWRDGWIAARQARLYDKKRLSPESLTRLTALEVFLRPKDLVDRVRGIVLGSKGGRSLDFDDMEDIEDDDFSAAMERATSAIVQLGRDIAMDEEAFQTLLPDLVDGDHKTVAFAKGLALQAEHPESVWNSIAVKIAETGTTNMSLVGGFLLGLQERDPVLTDRLLEDGVIRNGLAARFPVIQSFVPIDARAIARLHRALDLGIAPIREFHNLAIGRASDPIPGSELKRLLLAIKAKPDGEPVAIDILAMRIHGDQSDKKQSAPEVAETGRALLSGYDFGPRLSGRPHREDHELDMIVRASLRGPDGIPIARQLVRDLVQASESNIISRFDYNDLIRGLVDVHPVAVLDELAAGDDKARRRSARIIIDLARHHQNPMASVPDTVLLDWCKIDPVIRYPFAAAIVAIFSQSNDGVPGNWNPITRLLLINAPNKETVFAVVASRLHPGGGVGSLSLQYEMHLNLLNELDLSDLPSLAAARDTTRQTLEVEVGHWRKREIERERERGGRFE